MQIKEKSTTFAYELNNNKKMQAVLSTYQMQILDSIARVNSDSELKEIRDLIADYFSTKALDAMDALCDKGNLSTNTIQSWATEHDRTPYNY